MDNVKLLVDKKYRPVEKSEKCRLKKVLENGNASLGSDASAYWLT